MLMKRTRSYQKDQHMGQLTSDVDSLTYFRKADELKKSSLFNVPGLFVGFNPKCSEPDSVRSPTSPLDFKVFSNLGNPFVRCSPNHRKAWDSRKVGLSIVDSLDHEAEKSKKILRASDSKNLLLRPQMRITTPNSPHNMVSFEAPKSLPKDVGIFPCENSKPSNLQKGSLDVLFHIGEASFQPKSYGNSHPSSLDSARHVPHLSRFASYTLNPVSNRNLDSKYGKDRSCAEQFLVPASAAAIPPHEIELSEDYTCVRKYGPNPIVTHIYCGCILECPNNELTKFDKNDKDETALAHTVECCKAPTLYPSSHFLSFCYSCKKKLEGEDIYMYRGEKAFCSSNCRLQEILIDEEMEKSDGDVSESSTKPPSNVEELLKVASSFHPEFSCDYFADD